MYFRPFSQNIEAEDDFTFNSEFNSKFKRIKVPLVSAREVVIEGSEGTAGTNTILCTSNIARRVLILHYVLPILLVFFLNLHYVICTFVSSPIISGTEFRTSDLPASVDEERRHLVEAAIVRIMKARKAMSHLDLVAEVIR